MTTKSSGAERGGRWWAGENASRLWGIVVYGLVTFLALALRLLTASTYGGQIDEPASLLAISRTADLGYPLFPSGVLYLQGAVFSYLAAPMTWFFDDTQLLPPSRLLYLLLALAVAPLSMALVHTLTRSLMAATVVGLVVALDPTLMVWGILIRPYGLLAAETVLVALLLVMLVRDGPRAKCKSVPIVVLVPIVFALGTFTHIGIWLLVPPLALCAVLIWGRGLFGPQRGILISGVACLVPLVAYLALGAAVGAGSGTATNETGSAFVGSHLFSWRAFLEMPGLRWELWTDNFRPGVLHWTMPAVVALASAALAFAWWRQRRAGIVTWQSQAAMSLVLVHWAMVLEVAFFVDMDPSPRYIAHALPLGYAITGVAAWMVVRNLRSASVAFSPAALGLRNLTLASGLQIAIVGLAVGASLAYGLAGAQWRTGYEGRNSDYWGATEWAAEHSDSEIALLTALPPAAWFWLDDFESGGVYFLAGPDESNRAIRYTKLNRHGEPGDYWLGVPSITSQAQLCAVLTDHAGAMMIVVDRTRLNASWGFLGEMRDIVVGSADTEHEDNGGTLVMRVRPVTEWDASATELCESDAGRTTRQTFQPV